MIEARQKATYGTISFIWNTQNKKIKRKRKSLSGCKGMGQMGHRLFKGHSVLFSHVEKVSRLGWVGDCRTLWRP